LHSLNYLLMKKICFLLVLFLSLLNGCKSTKTVAGTRSESSAIPAVAPDIAQAEPDFHDQSTWILGYFRPDQLTHYPYSTWYIKGFDDYQMKTDVINKLLEINKDELSIKIVLGVWCPDSRREVPKFMRILDSWRFPVEKVIFIGVDDIKQSPVGEYISLNIERVPTFILYKNNVEAGRIIENPVTSLEQDMVNILTGMNNNK
jgi:thiol-disulfide isomerase/thioredoxin